MFPTMLKSWLPVTKKRTCRAAWTRLGIEYLEERLAPASLPPDIVLGRALSAYTVGRVQNNRLDVTYTAYNQTDADITGVLLTSTLQSGVSFQSATMLPNRSGQELAWSLGTLPAFGRASVTLTVAFPGLIPLQIDSGAQVFGTQDARAVTDTAPAAALVNRVISADVLASTPDANTTDPFVQEQAAKLDYDPQRIFDYLNAEVGYESYVGSLRGARGTLWSAAGNSLDEASLGVALFRASGIPARYAQGTLSDARSKQLILSMFQPSFQTVGYIPVGTPVADPANDTNLLAETRNHYWLQIDTGGGFQNADTSGLTGGALGTGFTATTSTFTAVADSLRHKVRVKLDAETYSQIGAAFGLGNGLSTATVLDRTFNSVDLVGRPLSIGALVNTSAIPGLVISARTMTYSPYLAVGDQALPGVSQEHAIRGTDFQEVLTNFPLGSQFLTGFFLSVSLSSPAGVTTRYDRSLVDRIGFPARQGAAQTTVSIDPNGPPALTNLDIWTLDVSPGLGNPRPSAELAGDLARGRASLLSALAGTDPLTTQLASLQRQYFIDATRQTAATFQTISDYMTRRHATLAKVAAYFDSPRLTLVANTVRIAGQTARAFLSIDLRRDTIRAVAAPGQSAEVVSSFNFLRGLTESAAENEVVKFAGGTTTPVNNTAEVLAAARAQQIPLVTVTAETASALDRIDIPLEAKARITVAIGRGRAVLVPSRPVSLGGTGAVAWYEVDPTTGETIGVTQDGGHQGIIEYLGVIGVAGFSFGVVFTLLPQYFDKPYTADDIRTMKKGIEEFGSGFRGALLDAVTGGFAFFFEAGIFTVLYLQGLSAGIDPPIRDVVSDVRLPPVVAPNTARAAVGASAAISAGTVGGTTRAESAEVWGELDVSWASSAVTTFRGRTIDVGTGTVRDSAGNVVNSGRVAIRAGSSFTAEVSGPNSYVVRGTGRLSVYGSARPGLGVSGTWDQYTAAVTGQVTLTLTTDALILNELVLPAGTYSITTAAAALGGSGATSSPSYAGSVSITATDAVANLGSSTANITVGGRPLQFANGGALAGFGGVITVVAGGGADDFDGVTLGGTAANVLTVSSPPGTITADQNTPAIAQIDVNASFADTYLMTAEAPEGWTVAISSTGRLTVTPAPGLQGGIHDIRVVVRSEQKPELVAQTIVTVSVAPTMSGITFAVTPDTLLTVPYQGAQVPTAFQAAIRNNGPAADTFTFAFPNPPAGFTILSSGTTVTIPAGETGILGVYLRPNGPTLPAPGTSVTFTVTATSTTNSAITQTRTITFVMPAVHGITFTATPNAAGTTPGVGIVSTLTLTATGNVVETVALARVLSVGLTATGLPPTVTLNPGQTVAIPVTLTPASNTLLNSTLAFTATAAFSPLGDAFDQTVHVPVRVTAPGADAAASAAAIASQSGNTDLANRLSDLATSLTTLFQTPADAVSRAQALAAIEAITGVAGADQFVSAAVGNLGPARDQLAAAIGAAQVQAAITNLGSVLGVLSIRLRDKARHGFELLLPSNTAAALPGVPAVYVVGLRNNGSQATMYDLTVEGLPAGVTAVFDEPSVTLQPGEARVGGVDPITLSLSQATNSLLPASVVIRVTARPAPAVTLAAPVTLTVRNEFVSVAAITPTPAFTDPGGVVAVKVHLVNAVNRTQPVLASFVVRNAGGTAVFTSTPVSVTLGVQVSLTTIALGSFDTTGLPVGDYAIDVTVTDAGGTPITGGTGRGQVQVGLPVNGSIIAETDLTRTVPGVTAMASSVSPNDGGYPASRAIDGDLNTSWFTADGNAANLGNPPFIEVVFPTAVAVSRVELFGNRQFSGDHDFFAGVVRLYDSSGAEIYNSGVVNLPLPMRDASVAFPTVAGVRRVRFTATADELFNPGLAEVKVFGPIATLPQGDVTVPTILTVTARETFVSPLTLAGQVGTTAASTTAAVRGAIAYVAGSNVIDIIDTTNPAAPVLVSSFAQGLMGGSEISVVRTLGADMIVVGTSVSVNGTGFSLLIYSVADPLNPVLVSNTTIPRSFLQDMIVSGNLVLVPLGWVFGGGGLGGDVVAIDVSDPTNPVETDILFHTGPGVFVGPSFNTGGVPVTPTITYFGSNRNGLPSRVLVVDSSNSAALAATELDIPGTAWIADIARQGNLVLVVGSGPVVANITLNVLDATNPAAPVILGSLVTGAIRVSGTIQPLGNGLFAVGGGTVDGNPVLLLVDASNPDNIAVTTIPVPAAVSEVQVAGNLLYAVTATGLLVFTIGTVQATPFTASVRVPKGTGVAVVPGSFSTPPTRVITTDPNFDVLEWDRTFTFGQSQFTFTWQSAVTDLEVDETRDVTVGGAVAFTSSGTSGSFALPGTTVTAARVIGLTPAANTAQPGGTATYTVTLTNPTDAAVTYSLSVVGVPAGWVNLPASVAVATAGRTDVTLRLSPAAFAVLADYGFVVVASAPTGASGTVEGTLAVAGPAILPDPQSHGVVAVITPAQVTAGQGTAGVFVVRVTNAGSATTTFQLSALGLPPGVTAAFAQSSVTVPPGAGNFREVRFTLTPAVGTAAGTIPFTIRATSATSTGQAAGTLVVAVGGVRVTLAPGSAAPGATLTATLTNTGTATDTFDLSAAGPGGLVGTLGESFVTLAPGESRTVTLTTTAAAFAAQGVLSVSVVAQSRSNAAVRDAARADLLVAPSTGLTASFDPPVRTIPSPGTASFTLLVNNTGNAEDEYEATITGTTGLVAAALVGLDGLPTQTVSIFRLPGLSSGAILLRSTLTAVGTGTVTVTVRSLTDTNRYFTLTATVGTPMPPPTVLPPTATPQAVATDGGVPVVITLGGSDPNSPARTLTFTILTGPAHGTLGPVVGNTVTYTPSAGYVGPDEFAFAVTNGAATSTATVGITVRPPRPVLLGYHEFGVGAGAGGASVARFFNPDGSERFSRDVFPGLTGGVRVTSADFNGDGVADLVAGTGPGSTTRVVVLDGTTGVVLFSIQPFEDRFVGGVFVAAGDVNRDGVPDLVITPDESGGPRMRVFSGAGFAQFADFFGIDDPDFRGGARAAVGDVNGDGYADLVVSAGFGGGPRVSVIDGRSVAEGQPRRLFADFFVFEEALRNGAYVAVGDVDGDGFADVIAGGGPGGGPRVFALSGQDLLRLPPSDAGVVANFFGGNADNRGGIRVVARDLDGDRRADLVVGDGSGAGSRVTGYLGKYIAPAATPPEQFSLDAYPGFAGGVFVG